MRNSVNINPILQTEKLRQGGKRLALKTQSLPGAEITWELSSFCLPNPPFPWEAIINSKLVPEPLENPALAMSIFRKICHDSSHTHLLLSTPKISKMMSSNMVQEKAKVTEKTTCTTYCRTWNGANRIQVTSILIGCCPCTYQTQTMSCLTQQSLWRGVPALAKIEDQSAAVRN